MTFKDWWKRFWCNHHWGCIQDNPSRIYQCSKCLKIEEE